MGVMNFVTKRKQPKEGSDVMDQGFNNQLPSQYVRMFRNIIVGKTPLIYLEKTRGWKNSSTRGALMGRRCPISEGKTVLNKYLTIERENEVSFIKPASFLENLVYYQFSF